MPTKATRANSARGWKATQSKIKAKKKTKLALIVLGLTLLLIILGQTVNLTRTLLNPWNLPVSQSRNYLWDGEFNLNLVVMGKDASVLIFNPKEHKVLIIHLPNETYLEVPKGYGFWQLRSIYNLGELEKIGGNQLLKGSISVFLGLPFDGFVKLNGKLAEAGAVGLVNTLRQNPLNFPLKDLQTDLTLWELIRLKLSLSQVRFDKVKIINWVDLDILDEQILGDGTKVFISDPVRIDGALLDVKDFELIREHMTVAVFNATNHPFLAQKIARMITNLGGNVILIANAPFQLTRTHLLGEKSATLKKLKQVFALCSEASKCDKLSAQDLESLSSRAQINLILGEDSFQRF